jgi:phosphatidylglycerophosphatase A
MSQLIATFFYVGYLRPASGTWGSAAAVVTGWGLHVLGGLPLLIAATLVTFFIGTWATRRHMEATGGDDPSEVVIDEVVGQWLALWPLSWGLWQGGVADIGVAWPGLLAAFFLFRLFDIWKPGPVGKADRRHDALGVMLDDVFAGIFAGIAVLLLGYFLVLGFIVYVPDQQ